MTSSDHAERSTLAACIAHLVGTSAGEVPLDPEEQRARLSERGLGLVPVHDAATFSWAGPWIARRPARDGTGPRDVVMFGVPSGALWDPAGTTDEVLGGSSWRRWTWRPGRRTPQPSRAWASSKRS